MDVEVDQGKPGVQTLDEVPEQHGAVPVRERPGHKGVVALTVRHFTHPVGRVVQGCSLTGVVGMPVRDEVTQWARIALVGQGRDDGTGIGPER